MTGAERAYRQILKELSARKLFALISGFSSRPLQFDVFQLSHTSNTVSIGFCFVKMCGARREEGVSTTEGCEVSSPSPTRAKQREQVSTNRSNKKHHTTSSNVSHRTHHSMYSKIKIPHTIGLGHFVLYRTHLSEFCTNALQQI